jgi:hypothetical protein
VKAVAMLTGWGGSSAKNCPAAWCSPMTKHFATKH